MNRYAAAGLAAEVFRRDQTQRLHLDVMHAVQPALAARNGTWVSA